MKKDTGNPSSNISRTAVSITEETQAYHRNLIDYMLSGYTYCRMILEEGQPPDFIHEEVNAGYEKLTGLKNVVGRRVSEVFPGIFRTNPEFIEKHARVAESGISDRFEIYLERLDKWLDISVYSPQKGYFVAMFDVITERKKTEDALRKSEERFRKLFKSHSAVMLLLDPDTGNIIDANESAATFYGWSIEKLCRMRIQQITSVSAEEAIKNMEKARNSEQNQFIFRHKREDGSLRDVEVFSNRIEIEGKDILYAIIHDITDRKCYESLSAFRLRLLNMAETDSLEEMLRATLDEAERLTQSTIGFCHFIGDDRLIPSLQIASTHIERKMHWKEREEPHPNLIGAEFWDEAIREKRAVIQNDYNSVMDQKIRPDGHPALLRTLVVPILRGDEVMAVLGVGNKPCVYVDDDVKWVSTMADFAWDIVARKLAEQSEQEMQIQLTQSQKMELVGQLAGGIAHDFNNMLGVILGNIEMAINHRAIEEPLLKNLKNILRVANRSSDLTRQLLTFARKESVMPVVLELNTIVEKMLTVLRQLIGSNITIAWAPDRHRTLIKVDPTQIDQILVNLCVNARDSIAGIGMISIETGRLCLNKTDGACHHPCKVPGDYVTLSVIDNGCGISKEHFPHIFEPFFTTKDTGKGTGLGLSTVYGIVKQNNGCIDIQSEPGKGTTIKIHFPRYSNSYTDPDDTEQQPSSIKHGKETILLVEDEPDILNICRLMLEQSGYTVLSAVTPLEAIRIAETTGEMIHLLLTDVVMPEMNGCDLSRKIQSIIPGLKILFMSGYATDVIANQYFLDEGTNFIQKPFSLKSLTTIVNRILKAG